MTPVVPFDPGRTPSGRMFKLVDAYQAATLRSVTRKLRELAVLSPETCERRLQLLDGDLARQLDDVSCGRGRSALYLLAVADRFERRFGGKLKPGQPERLRHLLRRAAREQPALIIVLERLVADVFYELEHGVSRPRGGKGGGR